MPHTREHVLIDRAVLAESLGARLASGRKAANLSQKQAAEAVGLSQSQLAKIEVGRRHLSFVEGVSLARLYGLDPLRLVEP